MDSGCSCLEKEATKRPLPGLSDFVGILQASTVVHIRDGKKCRTASHCNRAVGNSTNLDAYVSRHSSSTKERWGFRNYQYNLCRLRKKYGQKIHRNPIQLSEGPFVAPGFGFFFGFGFRGLGV